MHLEPGQAIGPYHLLSTLGSGGMGTVYLAEDRRLGRKVALKFLHPDLTSAEDDSRLLREARAASALNHPNICQVYDVGGPGEPTWIAMEYVDGRPLSGSIPAGGMQPEAVVGLATAVAAALAHAHQRGILHRDLKPSNIVCDREGRPKILDFGIASRLPQSAVQEMTRTGTAPIAPALEGSLPYMAPEVLRGETPDARTDLWSVGVLLYELLTGRLPYRGATALELASAIIEARIPTLPSTVPAPLARIVLRLLAKNPADRYGSAAEVGAAFDAISPGAGASAARRRVLAALGVVAVLAAAGYFVWRATQFQPLTASAQRLVSTAEASHAPSYSPDAAMLALVVPDASGVPQIRVADLARGTSIQITSGGAAGRPRWSPKGDQIVFVLEGQGIWSVSPLGGPARRLLASGFNPNFSADGARLVFEDRGALWTAASDGSDVREVPGTPPVYYSMARGPAFSPDGTRIAFFHAEAGPNGDLWVIPSQGGAARRLTADLREGGWPVWTPDGRAIIYSSARAGSRTLWQVPADGGNPAALTTGAGDDDQPAISADGRHVAYTNVRNTWDLRIRDLASGVERSLLQRGIEMQFPMFSPDGTRIAFFGRADFAVAIFTIAADGSDLRQLTAGREMNHHPRWSADGKDVYFFQVSPELSFRRVPAIGGPSVAFRPWDWITSNGALFDPAGRSIVFLRQRPLGASASVPEPVILHEVETGRERVWSDEHVHPGGWSQDSLEFVGWRHDGNVVICRVRPAGCRVLTQRSTPVWPLGSGRVYFARPANRLAPQELWSVAVDGSGVRHEAVLGTFRPIDRFLTVSSQGAVAWSRFEAGRHEVWTAAVR
ncbi:MAG: protein kinase [Acidobacteria bacterium]|nr:protein kinase [Acidobacteriota bacterium]